MIDLTNTPNRTRYYQPYDWRSNGIEYKWIKCEGVKINSLLKLFHVYARVGNLTFFLNKL